MLSSMMMKPSAAPKKPVMLSSMGVMKSARAPAPEPAEDGSSAATSTTPAEASGGDYDEYMY